MSVDPTPPPATESALPAPAHGEDLLGVRIGAALIDLALLYGLAIVLSVTIGGASVGGGGVDFYLDGGDVLLYVGLVLVYYFAAEATIGRTVGKLLVGLRVVGRDGRRPPVAAVAVRTLLRLVDWLPLLYLVGFLTMLATGRRRQRLGDLAARTGIARAAPIRHRGRAAAAVAFTLVLVVGGSIAYVAATDDDAGAKTYHRHGVSFSYPEAWEEAAPQITAGSGGGNKLWDTSVAAAELDLVIVQAYRLNVPITAENLDTVKPEVDRVVQQIFEQTDGTVQAGPDEITVGGKPGLRASGTGTIKGTSVGLTFVFVFDGTTQYFLNCEHTAGRADEIERGCEQIVRTFTVDQQRPNRAADHRRLTAPRVDDP
jgi:uncharacterized RDD family membrane protein YckC